MSLWTWLFYKAPTHSDVEVSVDDIAREPQIAEGQRNFEIQQQQFVDALNSRIDSDDLVINWKAKGFQIKNRPITFSHLVNHARASGCHNVYYDQDNTMFLTRHLNEDAVYKLATYVLYNVIKFTAYGEDFSYDKIASIEKRKQNRAKAAAFLKVLAAFDYPEDANA